MTTGCCWCSIGISQYWYSYGDSGGIGFGLEWVGGESELDCGLIRIGCGRAQLSRGWMWAGLGAGCRLAISRLCWIGDG